MLHHLSIGMTDRNKSTAFYDAVLGEIGLSRVIDFDEAVAYGPSPEAPFFWLVDEVKDVRASGLHVAFDAPNRGSIHKFHEAALENGGTDDGSPGARDYTEHYYAAFVLDPDGNKIEACCLRPV